MTHLQPRVSFPQERLPNRDCPACGADGLRSFYAATGVPVRSDRLAKSADAAMACPTGDVLLALCETCGFVFNALFDESLIAATDADEIAPARIAGNDSSNDAIARQWVERYGLAGKTVVDVRCGDGEFLEQLCTLAHGRGIGFDPVVRRERAESAEVIYVAGRFDDFAAEAKADFIFGRNALQRIADPLAFLTKMREPLDSTPVAFTVPDAARLLGDGAFWNLAYEQCNYFTRESLNRVFQRAGFEVTRLANDEGDASIVLEAEPTGGQKRDMPTLSELRLASQFVRVCTTRLHQWTTFAGEVERSGLRCVIWGSGPKTANFLAALGQTEAIAYVVDSDLARQGLFVPGTRLQVMPRATLRTQRPDIVIVTDAADHAQAERELAAMRLTPELLSL